MKVRCGDRRTALVCRTAQYSLTGPATARVHRFASCPDPDIFSVLEFNFDSLSQRLRELAFLNRGVLIDIRDERSGKEKQFCYDGGIRSFVDHLNRNKTPLHPEPIYLTHARLSKEGGTEETVEIALQWTDGYQEQVYCFTNTINNRDGGCAPCGLPWRLDADGK